MTLQGQAAGLQVTSTSAEPGGGTNIRIRGNNSIRGNNNPLIVVDGYPLPEFGEAGTDRGAPQTSNLLAFLNPSDIESVEILKDASATAIYGARGANGVVIVTTRKGETGETRIEVGTEIGFHVPSNLFNMMDGKSWALWRNEIAIKDGNPIPYDGEFQPTPENVNSIDWLKEITREAFFQKYNINVLGGSDRTQYAISGSVLSQEGILLSTVYNRMNGSLNLNTKLANRLSVNMSINYAQISNDRAQTATTNIISASALFDALRANPAVEGGTEYKSDPLSPTEAVNNPLTQLKDKKDETSNKELFSSLKATYQLSENIDIVLQGGLTNKDSRRDIYYPRTVNYGFLYRGAAFLNIYNMEDILLENYFNYKKKISAHTFNLTGGYSLQTNTYNLINLNVNDFPDDKLQSYALQTGLSVQKPYTYTTKRKLNSYFLRAGYNYNEKYYLNFSARIDGSSVFAKNNKYGFFPSISASWRIDQEDFLSNSIFSTLKLRGSVGNAGSQAINPYGSLARISSYNYVIADKEVSGLAPSTLSNIDLKWEETFQVNFGLDFGFFNEKFYGSIDCYDKKTNNLLQDFRVPPSCGFTTITRNIGSLKNSGIEIVLGYRQYVSSNFNWGTKLNFTSNRSKILDLGGNKILGGYPADNIINFPATIMREGEVFGAFYGYELSGLIQKEDIGPDDMPTIPVLGGYSMPGSWKFVDQNKDGVINDDDKTIIGDPNPDFTFGWNTDLCYKNLSLSFLVYGSIGNDIYNATNLFINSGYTMPANQTQDWFNNRWSESNQHNDIRYPSSSIQATLSPNSASIEDASFVRLKNVVLTYDWPLNNSKYVQKIQLSFTTTNLLTFTRYSGFDPEVSQYQNSNTSLGFDFGAYPRAKSYLLGIRVNF
jgi:TonB-linked SusC/RagA family outer membrane protein